jgi:hypothetical protein
MATAATTLRINLLVFMDFNLFLDNAAFRDDLVGAGLVPARPAPSGAGIR